MCTYLVDVSLVFAEAHLGVQVTELVAVEVGRVSWMLKDIALSCGAATIRWCGMI